MIIIVILKWALDLHFGFLFSADSISVCRIPFFFTDLKNLCKGYFIINQIVLQINILLHSLFKYNLIKF